MLDYLRNMNFYDADDGGGEGAGVGGNGDNGDGDQPKQPEEPKKPLTKDDVLRDLSKELGINAFNPEEVKGKFAEYQEWKDSQLTEQEKLQEQVQTYEQEKSAWENQRLEYESKLKATQLGIKEDNLADVLKLADNDPNKIEEVVKKYPIFKSKEGVKIGLQDPHNNKQPTDMSEVETYMSQDPKYRQWLAKNKK